MDIKQLAMETAIVGLATTAVAYTLQFGYRVTNFYPPDYVFYFAIGASTHIIFELLGLNKKYAEYKLSVEDSKAITG